MKFNRRWIISLVFLICLVLTREKIFYKKTDRNVFDRFLSGSSNSNSIVKLQEKKEVQSISNEQNDEEFMIYMKKRMKNRQILLRSACKKHGLAKRSAHQVKYAILKSYNLTYCFIPKSGCTNWKKILMTLNGDVNDINHIEDNVHAFVSNNFRLESNGIPPGTEGFLKLLVVRNPLDRLYSSYRDKFAWQPGFRLPQFSKTSSYIHRQEGKTKLDSQYLATFEEFIKFVSRQKRNTLYGLVANHWSTYNRICQPCHIKYDVIVHLETIDKDFKYLLKLIKAPNDLEFPAGYGKNGSSLSRHDDVMQVYKKLDQKLLKRLHKAYKVDFDMFGYNFLK